MALEIPVFKPGLFEANGDISTKQYYAVKMTTTDKRIVVAGDGEKVLGVLQNKPSAAGASAEVTLLGITKIVAGETLTAGDLWGADSNGKAKKIEGTVTGADVGDYFAGVVVEGAAANELATVTIGIVTGVVEAQ